MKSYSWPDMKEIKLEVIEKKLGLFRSLQQYFGLDLTAGVDGAMNATLVDVRASETEIG